MDTPICVSSYFKPSLRSNTATPVHERHCRGPQRPKQKTRRKTDHQDPGAVAIFREDIWTPLGGHESNRRRRHTRPLGSRDLDRPAHTPEDRLAVFQRSGSSEIREHNIRVVKSQWIGRTTDLALNTTRS